MTHFTCFTQEMPMSERFDPNEILRLLMPVLKDLKDPSDFPYKEFKFIVTPRPWENVVDLYLSVEWIGEKREEEQSDD